MPDQFQNARAYFTPTFPSSGDGFSIAGMKNALQGLGFLDAIPLQPRAHTPADDKIMVRGRDASNFYNPVYYGDADKRIPFGSGDTAAFAAPASNPRIDIVYMSPSGDVFIRQGVEAVSPTLPSLAPSGDSRIPICAVYNKTTQTKIVNFEDKDSNTGDGYIYQDLRPWIKIVQSGTATFGTLTPMNPTGDGQAGPGTESTYSRSDHVHGGVHAIRVPGSTNLQGDIEFVGNVKQATGRLTFGDGPAFSAKKSGSQVIEGALELVTFETEIYDTDNNFDSSRFTPTKAGKYLLIGSVLWTVSPDNTRSEVTVYKNGVLFKYLDQSNLNGGSKAEHRQGSIIVEANGTTDYFEMFAGQDSGGNESIDSSQEYTFFEGCYLRS